MTVTLDSPALGKVVKQTRFMVPDFTIKDLLSAIPAHCFRRSALRSSSYVAWDLALLAGFYSVTKYLDALITPEVLSLPDPRLYTTARLVLWALYGFWAGLVGTGVWILAHECGHQSFSESKTLNNTVGWILHSALGVPYHSWRITHAKHHASTNHMTEDHPFLPRTRAEKNLPAFDPTTQDSRGAKVSSEVMNELYEALGDSPIVAVSFSLVYLLFGWPLYLFFNSGGNKRYPSGTNHFNPNSTLFKPQHYRQVLISDVGCLLWLAALVTYGYYAGFLELFRVYLVPYLWVNHWIILITFLQHTDPLLPHYRAGQFTFPRGALSTLNRNLLGDCGPLMGWLGATMTHGISETHVLHHVCSKIPHYHAWEASTAIAALLAKAGIVLEGAPGGWAEVYRVMKACRFVEDEGDIVFFKNAYGLAAAYPVYAAVNDSAVEIDTDSE